MRGLPDESLTLALMRGGREQYGWTIDRHLQADIFDALMLNTEATGHWSQRPSLGRWPRPKPPTSPESPGNADETRPVSVKDIWTRISR